MSILPNIATLLRIALVLFGLCCHLSEYGETSGIHLVSTGGDKLVSVWPLHWNYPRKMWFKDGKRDSVIVRRNPFNRRYHQRPAERRSQISRTEQLNWIANSPDTKCISPSPWSSTCWVVRQVGTSLTLEVDVEDSAPSPFLRYVVRWFQRFKLFGESNVLSTEITKDVIPSNMVLGSGGQELRIRPLHSYDMDENSFRAVVSRVLYPGSDPEFLGNITFRILEIPVEMGMKNAGEEVRINILDHLTLPEDSMSAVKFRWHLERSPGHYAPLASNMRVSPSGQTLSILGLREDQTGIIACSVYDRAGVFYSKKRFHLDVKDSALSESAMRSTRKHEEVHRGNVSVVA